ncbi:MAG: aspartate/tyrosine/aromatic aminotransferase [Acetobacteraceae bacterium]|nr:aspartate/tyrosine/aromatic aminotransferase [Acetobacteraceae bacterium]
MFQTLQAQPADPLLALISLFQDDPRDGKLDLGVGTYRDERGITPVMGAVKEAERMLVASQRTKAYLGVEGDRRFVDLVGSVAFGAPTCAFAGRLTGVQTPGGSGALRLGAELIAAARPGARVWVGTPTWPNHHAILDAVGLSVAAYRYHDPATQSLCLEEMLAALSRAQPGDVVLLHGCCHNPTGAELNENAWGTVIGVLAERGLVPFIDLAYQGLGRGLDADAEATRRVLASVEEALVAYSCDKNFGLYRERTGALFALARDAEGAEVVRGVMLNLARANWSMPPDHGAAVVRGVLESEELGRLWREELGGMCRRIGAVRHTLAAAEPRLSFLCRQRGMFSQLPIARAAIAALRGEHGIYMASSGRINVAGLRAGDARRFVDALAAVGGLSA